MTEKALDLMNLCKVNIKSIVCGKHETGGECDDSLFNNHYYEQCECSNKLIFYKLSAAENWSEVMNLLNIEKAFQFKPTP